MHAIVKMLLSRTEYLHSILQTLSANMYFHFYFLLQKKNEPTISHIPIQKTELSVMFL